jgi:hypothetical protein
VELPTKNLYSSKVKIEKAEYGSVSVKWDEGKVVNASNPWQGMMYIAGSYAAGSAVAVAQDWDSEGWEWNDATTGYKGVTVIGSTVPGSLAAVSWNTPPNMTKNYAAYDKYAITLTPYSYTDNEEITAGYVQPVVSLPVEFTSQVGLAVGRIKTQEQAGTFSVEYYDGVKAGIEGLIYTFAVPQIANDKIKITWSPPYENEIPDKVTAHTLTVKVGPGTDDEVFTETITVTVKIRGQFFAGS